jgi:3D (Asp-Asp-Asp) domain-containing protein
MADGRRVHDGAIAVDPRLISLGTKVQIQGKTYTAEDTGSAIKGRRIDKWYSSCAAAIKWGARRVRVTILGED